MGTSVATLLQGDDVFGLGEVVIMDRFVASSVQERDLKGIWKLCIDGSAFKTDTTGRWALDGDLYIWSSHGRFGLHWQGK